MKYIFSLLLAMASAAAFAVDKPTPSPLPFQFPLVESISKKTYPVLPDEIYSVDLRDADLSQVVNLFFGEFLDGSFSIAPEVVEDHRRVSLRWSGKKNAAKPFLAAWLAGLGVGLHDESGVVRVARLLTPEKIKPELFNLFYRPKFNTASSLQAIVSGLVGKGQFLASRGVDNAPSADMGVGAVKPGSEMGQGSAKPGTAAAVIDRDEKLLVFRGTAEEKKLVEDILMAVDLPTPVVSVVGVIYEVALTKGEGSAMSVAGAILGGKLGVSFGGATKDNFLKVELGGLEGIVSALDNDSRFKIVSSPRLSVRSGATARLTVGQEVPVVGAISQNATGTVQSVEYRSSGVILELKPVVFDDLTRLTFMQQISSFVKTDTGVNSSPTMMKREARTDVDLKNGEVFVVGGLVSSSDSASRSGLPFLPRLMDSKATSSDSSELLVLLQINRL